MATVAEKEEVSVAEEAEKAEAKEVAMVDLAVAMEAVGKEEAKEEEVSNIARAHLPMLK